MRVTLVYVAPHRPASYAQMLECLPSFSRLKQMRNFSGEKTI